jgi:hypothetical protein
MKRSADLPADFVRSLCDQQKHRVKSIEDRIEQSWKALDIVLSVNVINGIAGPVPPPPMSQESERLLQDMAANAKHLANALGVGKTEETSQFDIDRNNIWDAVRRNGVAVVLSFIDTQLVTNIEKFFSGLVVSYITMFNKGQRTALPADKIFANDAGLKALHTRFYDLRDKWYAHVVREDGRHALRYRVDEQGAITIDKKGEQITPEHHLSEFVNLFNCAYHVASFIDKDLDEKVAALMKTLTQPQKDILCRHWNRANNSAELG